MSMVLGMLGVVFGLLSGALFYSGERAFSGPLDPADVAGALSPAAMHAQSVDLTLASAAAIVASLFFIGGAIVASIEKMQQSEERFRRMRDAS